MPSLPTPPRGWTLPDTSHLSPEDAELFVALYLERNAVSWGEAARVRADIARTEQRRRAA
jgi:hypothetical protein